jgi:hypothetical protein
MSRSTNPAKPCSIGSKALKVAIGVVAVGAVAAGAVAIGSVVVGALVMRRFVKQQSRIGSLGVPELNLDLE